VLICVYRGKLENWLCFHKKQITSHLLYSLLRILICGDPLFLMLNNIAVTLLIGPNRYYDVDLKSIN